MASFQGSVLGALLTLLGWDGSAFRNVKVDSSGHLQVDVLANVLGGDQATETTSALVKAQIGALTSPASGSTNKLLTDSLTSLQLIDDLRGALDSVNTDELVVNVDSSVLPTDAATETSLQGIEDQVKDTLCNIKSALYERLTPTTTSGSFIYYSTEVPSGEVHRVTMIVHQNITRALTQINLAIIRGGTGSTFWEKGTPVQNSPMAWEGDVWLDAGDKIQIHIQGAGVADGMVTHLSGMITTV